jgi:CRP-like cAMP-binding protein
MYSGVHNSGAISWETLLGDSTVPGHLAAGEQFFRAGETPRIGVVREGVIRVFLITDVGRQVTVRYARDNAVVGLAASIAGSRAWNAEAVTQSTVALLSTERLRAAATEHPQLAWSIAEDIASSASGALQSVALSSTQSISTRVAQHLREVALPAADGRPVAHTSHQRLADAAGTVREVVSRELRRLRADGVIAAGPGRLVVLDEARLDEIAAGRRLSAESPPAAPTPS